MKARANIRKNTRGLDAFKKALSRIDKDRPIVKVGLLGTKNAKRRGEALTNPELGIVHEFGTSRIPARPFLRPSVAKNAQKYEQLLAAALKKAITGETAYEKSLALIGQVAAADVKNYVTQGAPIPPPNAPATLRRKEALTRRGSTGSPRTLVDTGRMVGAITYAIEKGGSEK